MTLLNPPKKKHEWALRIISALLIFFFLPSTAWSQAPLLSESDRLFLEQIEKDSIQYFIRYSDRQTGLTQDSSRPGSPASIAATGFSLAGLAIAYSHGWISEAEAFRKIRRTLETLRNEAHHENGFFYHFLDLRTGRRVWKSEASSIDTALLVAGSLLAGQYFKGTEIAKMAEEIYERVNWKWMMNRSSLLCHGWKPESGFLPHYWDSYSEHMILQALAIGSGTYPIPPKAWYAWDRFEDEYNGRRVVYSHTGSLFTYQYAQAFIDFRNLWDGGIDYFANSRNAVLANREYALASNDRHLSYSPSSWGLSASLGPGGYKAYGAKPGLGLHDGTIAPSASLASIVFTPGLSLRTIKSLYRRHRDSLYGPYGFKNAFNLEKRWWAQEYLGVDQGISVLMLENYLSEGTVWKKFMQLPAIQNWLGRCGALKIRPEDLLLAKEP